MEVAADENHSPHAASQPTAKMAAAADMLLDAECFAEDVVDGLDEDLDECGMRIVSCVARRIFAMIFA